MTRSAEKKRQHQGPKSLPEHQFFDNSKGTYFTCLSLPLMHKDWYNVQPTCEWWTIRVGETIAVACQDSTLPPTGSWAPFNTKWAPAQVLALYKNGRGVYRMSFRWLYWHKDLPVDLKKELPCDEIFEHYTRETYDPSMALGRLHLSTSAVDGEVLGTDGMPRVFAKCRNAIVKKGDMDLIQEVKDHDMSASLERALFLLNDKSLQEETTFAVEGMENAETMTDSDESSLPKSPDMVHTPTTSQNEEMTDSDKSSDEAVAQSQSLQEDKITDSDESSHEVESPAVRPSSQYSSNAHTSVTSQAASQASNDTFYASKDQVSYYWSLQVNVRKRHYSKALSHSINLKKWTLQVGDLVAVKYKQPPKDWFPFTMPWSPAQVVALSHEKSEDLVYVRWFYRNEDFDRDVISDEVQDQLENDLSSKLASKLVYEHHHVDAFDLDTILGRVVLTSSVRPSTKFLNNVQDDEGIPQAPLICRSNISKENDIVTPIDDWNKTNTSDLRQLQRGLECVEDKLLRSTTLALVKKSGRCESSNLGPITADDQSDTEMAAPQLSSRPSPPARTVISIGDDVNETSPEETSVFTEEEQTRPSRQLRLQESFARQAKRPAPEQHQDLPKKCARRCEGDLELLDSALQSFVNDYVDVNNQPAHSQSVVLPDARATHKDAPKESAKEEGTTETRVYIPQELRPFHEDFSTFRSYYSEICVKPPYGNYAVQSKADEGGEPWIVRMGDSVIVHYKIGAGKTNFGKENGEATHFPFKVPWAVANIVAIWKTHKSKSEMKKSKGHSKLDARDDIMMEIRWFYRKNELPGSCKSVSVSENEAKHSEYEEIFETDHMQECEATSLLAPVKLHESAARTGLSKMQQGMPLIDVHCCRFWSIHRKALLPCGSLAGIVERGKMHSKYLGKVGVLNAALGEFEGGMRSQPRESEQKDAIQKSKDWKRAFTYTIEKLGLSDASEDTSVRGIRLTGRDREQEEIMTFLRSRICGDLSDDEDGDNAKNSSLFVAGPPGTGKTASVHSVIARLRVEQAKGKVPAFDFVSLNGMEMRHPFEAYVKFWEVMSGPEKEKKPPEIAAALLERRFAGRRRDGDEESRPVVVLLLDEIDYLMTKKQTVLYNFFDWPVRSCESGNGARLIVVGISNTMNLPSRLKPSVQSRLGGKMCQFRAYNVKDMMAILKSKIQSNKSNSYLVFEDDAIQFAARKAASVSGDIRKALHICKAAAEAVMQEEEAGTRVDPKRGRGGPVVRISDVQKASRESFTSVMSMAVAFSTSLQALLLVSLSSLTRTTGRQEGGYDINELMTKMESISGSSGDPQYSPPPTFGETLEMLNRLGETRLVSLHTPKSSGVTFRAAQGGSGGAWPLISLPMDSGNILRAFRATPHSTLADKHLGSLGMY